ncbi:peptidoglycan-binding protein [Streptomyces pseudovenezuelae]|uniref:peptidoglycan-binding protein n=1 Tax=Streptomyces pseudovenezuelae TaxID=67350 RepID=UPI0036E6CA14
MATPLSASTALSAFKAEGLDVREVRLWATHNRNHVGAWGPVNGVMIHHTGPYSSTSGMVALCYNGRDDLPGPLCHGVIDKTGAVHLVGWGRANHAGRGDSDVLDAVKAETKLPVDDQGNADGNPHFYGFELINAGNGKDPWPEAQVEAAARAAAALCRKHGWTAESVIGHKEWQPGKIDPTFDMGDFRARVAVLLKDDSPAEPAKPSPPKFPGRNAFGPGKSNASILLLGQQLVRRGFGKHYRVGPSRDWGEADRLNVVAFQRAQGWTGSNADGYPGPETWRRLFS